MSVQTATAAGCVILTPWIEILAADAHAERLKTIYSDGLVPWPCRSQVDELDTLIQTYQPEKATLEISEFPTFGNEARIVQIAGNHLYSIEFKPLNRKGNKGRPELNTEVAPKIAVAEISHEASQELRLLLTADIRHVQPRELTIVDGVGYMFNITGVGCAYTNSPSSSSRAGKLTELYSTLLRHASITDVSALQESDHNILAAARALRVE